MRTDHRQRGSALLTVLWLSAALSAIAFTVAATVRSETNRTGASIDGTKAQYLASAGVDRTLLYILWGRQNRNPDGSPLYYERGMNHLEFDFPTGHASVDIIPENAKLNVNNVIPDELFRLFSVLGMPPDRARMITLAILDWRTPAPPDFVSEFDQQYLAGRPSFRGRHASMQEIEELLLVKGMTPELFYGTYERAADGTLQPRHGVRDCLSVFGHSAVDVNTADPAVLAAVGLPPEVVARIAQRRQMMPFQNAQDLLEIGGPDTPGFNRLTVGGSQTFTLRSTGRPRSADGTISDARRTVAEVVAFPDPKNKKKKNKQFKEPYHVLRWYDNVWVQ